MRRRRLLSATTALAASSLVASALAREARADVTSWLAFGGGGTAQIADGAHMADAATALTYSIGVGSTPRAPIVVGLLYRGATYITLGTDVGVAARVATGGFARGNWGVALDAGAFYRSWGGGDYGSWPLQGVATIGGPWGFGLALGAQTWSIGGGDPAEGFFAAIEIDLLRLTLMRQGPTERWWPNPDPAGGRQRSVGILSW